MDKSSDRSVYEFEGFRLEVEHLMLYRGDEEVAIPPKAVETLLALLERRGEIVSKDELMRAIWSDAIVEESNLALYLHILRKTLGKSKSGKPFIETLRRRGYRLNGEIDVRVVRNGVSGKQGDAGKADIFSTVGKLPEPDLRARGVERRGNVLALADWKGLGTGEPSSNITSRPDEPSGRHRSVPVTTKVIAASVSALVLVAAFFLAWSRYQPLREATDAKSDLTFTNLTSGEVVDAATISPNGDHFAYASHEGDLSSLWLQQSDHASRIQLTEPIRGRILGITFTRDGKQIYFNAADAAGTAVYRVPSLGGIRTKVVADVVDPVSFSPDGSEMVFTRRSLQSTRSWLIVAASDGTNERILREFNTPEEQITNGGPAWSPDGRLIAYGVVNTRLQEGICKITATETQTGTTQTLSSEAWDNCYRMAWTRDGAGLVFVGTRLGEALSPQRDQIYYLSASDGEARRLTSEGRRHQVASLGITDRDEILAVPFDRMSQIWSMHPSGDSRTAIQITRGLADGRAGIAPLADGRVAYLTRHGDGLSIWRMNADGTDRRQIMTDPSAIEELRAPSDGSFFVFSGKRDGGNHLYRVDPDGGKLTQLTFGEGSEIDSSVSPDGKWIVYQSEATTGDASRFAIWRIDAERAGPPIRLTDHDCLTPHFSPDGRSLSCVSSDWRTISMISAENGSIIKTFMTSDNPILNAGARWSHDGKALVYITYDGNAGNLRRQPIDGSDAHALTDFSGGEVYNFAFSMDGSRLFLARGYATRNAVLIKNFR